MANLDNLIADLEDIKFQLDKAEFNHEPTEELEAQYNTHVHTLIDELSHQLRDILPDRLPPLEIGNPNSSLTIPNIAKYEELIERIGVSDEEDEDLLIQLSGTNEDHLDLLNYLGVWYALQMQPEEAAGYFQEALSSSENDVINFNLAYAMASQKVLKPALNYLEEIESDVNPGLVELNRAVIYHRLGRYEEATKHFKTAAETEDHRAKILYNWGCSALEFNKTEQAEMIFSQLQKLDPSYPDLHFQFGQIHAQKGDYPAAILSFREALQQEPENLEVLSDIGTACLIANRYEDAIEYFQRYLDHGSSISVLNNLGAAYLKSQQYEEAVNTFEQALELKPNHNQTKKNLEVARSYLD